MAKNPIGGMQVDEHQSAGKSDCQGRLTTSARLAPSGNSMNIQCERFGGGPTMRG